MDRIARLIQGHLNLPVFVPLLGLALAATWYGLFASVESFAAMTGGLSFMDMQPRLTVDTLFEQIRTYAPETISYYIGWSVFDYIWPFLTFTTMLFISAWLISQLPNGSKVRFSWLIASAYLTVLMDWLENIGFVALVTAMPAEPLWLARLTLGFHALKLLANMVFNLLFWVLLGTVIVVFIRRRIFAAPGN
jgi:hypothetical protein